MKIIKYIVFTIIVGGLLFLLGIIILGGYYADNYGTGRFQFYSFKINEIGLKKELKNICLNTNITTKDSIVNQGGGYVRDLVILKNNKENKYIIHFGSSTDNSRCYFSLIYVSGKTNDDFGWFSWEKYKKVKLFEETIIEPLSDKYERIE